MKKIAGVMVIFFFLIMLSTSVVMAVTEKDITSKLVCQCGCDNMLVSSCNCQEAAKMSQYVKERLAAGASEEEILDEMVSRYGEKVLAEPRKTGFNLFAWIIPIVGVIFGAGLIFFLIRRWVKEAPAKKVVVDETTLKKYREKLQEDLKEWE